MALNTIQGFALGVLAVLIALALFPLVARFIPGATVTTA